MPLTLRTLTGSFFSLLFPTRNSWVANTPQLTSAEADLAEFKKKAAYYEDLFNNLPNDLVVFDAEHRYQYLNNSAIKDPVVRDFMLGKTDFDYCKLRGISTEMAEMRHERFKRAIASKDGEVWREVKEKDGKREVVSRRFKPVRNDNGTIKYVLGYALEITELHQTETHLLEMLEEHKQMMSNSFTGIVIANANMLISEMNNTATKILGYATTDIAGTCFAKLVYASAVKAGVKDSLDQVNSVYRLELVGKRTEMQLLAKDGSLVWVEMLIQEQETQGKKKFIIFLNDARSRKQKELEMEMLSSFPRENPNPVLRVDGKTLQLTYINKAAHRILDYEPNGYDVLLKHLYTDIAKGMQYGFPRINECFVFNGWYLFTIAPNTNMGYVNIYVTDITEQKRTETAYAELNNNLKQIVETRTKELNESNTNLQNFAGSVSHDLRAPLRQISGYMSLLKRRLSEADADSAAYVNEVITTVRKMDEQIKALLQLSKIGTAPLHPSVFCIQEVFDKAVELYKGYFRVKHMEYSFEADSYAYADVSLVGVVIDNLVSNAIKYSSERECVRLRVSGYKEGGMLVYCIEDNGVGFDMKYYEKIFGVFQRLHSNTQFTGMGIGLTFVRKIIEKHEGKIWAESREGEGTKFFFSLPEN